MTESQKYEIIWVLKETKDIVMGKKFTMSSLIGKHLDVYNDGKISPSRHARVVVEDVVPLFDLHPHYRDKWFKTGKKVD